MDYFILLYFFHLVGKEDVSLRGNKGGSQSTTNTGWVWLDECLSPLIFYQTTCMPIILNQNSLQFPFVQICLDLRFIAVGYSSSSRSQAKTCFTCCLYTDASFWPCGVWIISVQNLILFSDAPASSFWHSFWNSSPFGHWVFCVDYCLDIWVHATTWDSLSAHRIIGWGGGWGAQWFFSTDLRSAVVHDFFATDFFAGGCPWFCNRFAHEWSQCKNQWA